MSYWTMSSHASNPNLWCNCSTHHRSKASDILPTTRLQTPSSNPNSHLHRRVSSRRNNNVTHNYVAAPNPTLKKTLLWIMVPADLYDLKSSKKKKEKGNKTNDWLFHPQCLFFPYYNTILSDIQLLMTLLYVLCGACQIVSLDDAVVAVKTNHCGI